MCRFAVLAVSFLIYEPIIFAASVDQRQTGDFNVQIDLKNLQIVGLMKGKEEYVDYDYAYDYSEMTIKPSSGTTQKPLNVTESSASDKDNITINTTVFAELDQTTGHKENSSLSTEIIAITTPKITVNTSTIMNTTSLEDSIDNSNSTSSNCKKGFFRNSKGDCELKLQNPSNALMKMLRQKSKLNGSNTVRRP